MRRSNRGHGWLRIHRLGRGKPAALVIATLGLCQLPLCFPDFLGAFSFELQSLISGALINFVDIVIRNILNL